jgi:hypothetical protein
MTRTERTTAGTLRVSAEARIAFAVGWLSGTRS